MLTARELAKRAIEASWQSAGRSIAIVVSGRSMGQTLPDGTTVVVKFECAPTVRRGEIIYFRRGMKRIVHRVLFILGPVIVEKGDANWHCLFCLRGDVLGRVLDIAPPSNRDVPVERGGAACR